jgi:hypothetical protein
MLKELHTLLDFLKGEGFQVIPLRGLALAQDLYGETSLRVVRDIDLLFPEKQVIQAVKALKKQGYMAPVDEAFLKRFVLPSAHTLELTRAEAAFGLDMHWGLVLPSRGISPLPQSLWENGLVEKEFFGEKVLCLNTEWTLVSLAFHAYHHQFHQFKNLVDISEFILKPEIDWVKVEEIGRKHKWTQVLRQSLTLCHTLFGAEIPESFRLKRLPSPAQLSPLLIEGLPPSRSIDIPYVAYRLLWPQPTDYQFLPLPAYLHFLYFFLRPLRGAAKILLAKLSRLTELFPFFKGG